MIRVTLFFGFILLSYLCYGQNDYRTIASGSWSSPNIWEKYDVISSTWTSTIGYPGKDIVGDNVLIRNGAKVNINIAVKALQSITIGDETSGTLQIPNTIASGTALHIIGDLVISSSGVFQVETNSSVHLYTLQLSRNIENYGVINFKLDKSECNLLIDRNGDQSFNGNGRYTLNKIELRLGDMVNTLNVNSIISMANGGLTLTRGTFKLSSQSTITPFNSGGTASITSSSGIWNNGGIINLTTGSLNVYGAFKITNGITNVGSSVAHDLILGNTSTVEINGGTLNIAGKWVQGNPGSNLNTMNISGGSINVSTKGQSSNGTMPTFFIESGQNFNMTGGNVVIQHAGSSGAAGDFKINSSSTNLSSGTITIGSGIGTLGNILLSSVVPLNDLKVDAGSTTPSLSTNIIVKGVLSTTSGSLNLNGRTLTINNAISGSGTIAGTNTSIIIINGNAGTLNFSPGAQILKDLTLSPSASATLGSKLYITGGTSTITAGTLSVGSGATLNTNNQLTIGSNQYGSARMAKVDGTIIGKVTVERFIPLNANSRTGRAWRLLTAPVTGTSINAAWQEGMYFDGTSHRLSSDNSIVSAVPSGYGTIITAHGPGNAIVANTNRFDYWEEVKGMSSSLRRYTSTDSGGNWNYGIPSSTVRIDSLPAYMLFVRGDRSTMLASNSENTTTLRATGIPRTGDFVVSIPPASSNLYTVVGNPYASAIDFEKIYRRMGADTVIKNRFWLWDANLNIYGGYRLVQRVDSTTYNTTPYSMDSTTRPGTSYRYIESCGGFFIEPVAGSTTTRTLTIKEDDKVSSLPQSSMFRMAARERSSDERSLYINLNSGLASSHFLADGVSFKISSGYSLSDGPEDVIKPGNFNESFAISRYGKNYMVEGRPEKKADTIYLNLQNLASKNYTLQFKAENFAGYTAYVVDRYTDQRRPVDLTGRITFFDFLVNADAVTKASNRFYVMLNSVADAPHYTSLKATPINGSVAIDWEVGPDGTTTYYEVEHSIDGMNFNVIAKVNSQHSTSSASYHYLHQQPQSGKNYYRIRAYDTSGPLGYSQIAEAFIGSATSHLIIYPNPVKNGRFTVQLAEAPPGVYSLKVFNVHGQLVYHHVLRHDGSSINLPVQLTGKLAAGRYHMQLTANGKQWKGSVVVQ